MAPRRTLRVVGPVLAVLLLDTTAGWAEREHFQLKVGAGYDQGDFGTSETTHTAYAPVTLRYLGERFDVGATALLIYLDSPEGITIVDGRPTLTGEGDGRDQVVGFGDTIIRARYFLVDDPGPGSWYGALAPFVKVKVPTGDEDRGLGTGEYDFGVGVEFDKQFAEIFFVFGDVSYTFMGDPPDEDFRDRPGASLGLAVRLGTVTASTMLDWRRALLSGDDDPLEVLGALAVKASPTTTITPYAFIGLTDGSPDWGLGFEMSYRFGRW
ncbi:MAG TPA: transporter [Methylomirabilota bacterium]|nr:transporter [Methylomirabilota bacterium]